LPRSLTSINRFKPSLKQIMKTGKKLSRFIGFSLLAALVAGIWLTSRKSPMEYRWMGGKDAQNPPAFKSSFEWKKGSSTAYQMEQVSTSGGASGAAVRVQGILHLRVLEVEEGAAHIAFAASKVKAEQGGERLKNLETLLQTVPCVIKMSARGQLLEMGFAQTIGTEDLMSLAGFYSTQFVLPPNKTSPKWHVVEEDINGTWNCSYQLMTDGLGMLKKRTASTPTKAVGLPIRVESSEIRSKIGEVWLSNYKAHEAWSIVNGDKVLMNMSTELTLTEIAVDQPEILAQLEAGTPLKHPRKPTNSLRAEAFMGEGEDGSAIQKDKMEILKEKFASVTSREAVDQLKLALATAKAHEDTVPAIHALRDMLLAYPSRADEVASLALENMTDLNLTARLFNALELAGSMPEAQVALAGILERKEGITDEAKLQASVAAGGVEALHGTALRDALYQTVRSENIELSDAASFALGNLANKNPELKQVLEENYTPLLSGQNENPDDQRVALRILANGKIGSESSHAAAEKLLAEHPDREVRVAAVDYLGRVKPDQSGPLIAALKDREMGVRLAAINAMTGSAQNNSEAISAVAQELMNPAREAPIREAAASGLASQMKRFPEARQSLIKTMNQPTTSPELREQIRLFFTDSSEPIFSN
jgi:hypothetical protein